MTSDTEVFEEHDDSHSAVRWQTGPAVATVISSAIELPVESPTHAVTPTATAAPRLGAIVRRAGLQLLIATVIPACVFTTLVLTTSITVALLGALFWSYSAVGWQLGNRCRRSGLLLVTSSVLTVRTFVALATGDTFVYFLQPIATDAMVATIFFASLATSRPVVARLAGDFYPMTDEVASRRSVQRLFARLTALWATLSMVKACVTFWLLQSQSVETFVVVKNAFMLSMNGLAIAVTIGAAVLVARKEGLLPSMQLGLARASVRPSQI